MDFIKQLKAFDDLSNIILTPNELAIYLKLFMLNNRLRWQEWFEATDYWLMLVTGIKRHETITSTLNRLTQKGFIKMVRGKGRKPSQYHIVDLCTVNPNVLLNSTLNSAKDSTLNSTKDSTSTSTSTSTLNSTIEAENPCESKNDESAKLKLETKTINNNKKRKIKENAFASVISPALKKALLDFEDMRKKIKAPMTDRAKELLLAKLDELSGGDDALKIKMLEQSIERGWKTVYTLKEDWREGRNGDSRSNGSGDSGQMSEWERAEMWQKHHRPWDLQSNAGGAGA